MENSEKYEYATIYVDPAKRKLLHYDFDSETPISVIKITRDGEITIVSYRVDFYTDYKEVVESTYALSSSYLRAFLAGVAVGDLEF